MKNVYRVRVYWQYGPLRGNCRFSVSFDNLESARAFRDLYLSFVSPALNPVIQILTCDGFRYLEG